MSSRTIRWNFDKESYSPGETALVSFWLENTGNTRLYLSELELEFDFGKYIACRRLVRSVPPRTNKFLGNIRLLLPENVVGRKFFTIKYRMHEYVQERWIDLSLYRSDKQYFVSIYPRPLYRVFISRGLSTEDRSIGESKCLS